MEKMLSAYYPGTDSSTHYALYAPAIERFLLIDKYNLFCFYRTAQVLSSKIKTVVIVLPGDKKVPNMNNQNCLEFGLNHVKFQAEINSDAKQNPTVSFLHVDSKIVKVRSPADFTTGGKKEKLTELQLFARFVNSCIHSIMLTAVINQATDIKLEQQDYEAFYFNKPHEPTLETNVMNILLFANNIREAEDQLEQYWAKYIQKNLKEKIFWPEKNVRQFSKCCTMFYEIANIQLPTTLKNILKK
jgi:hypothetical protein